MFESEETLSKIAQATYDTTPPRTIGQYKLIAQTPTLRFYNDDDKVIVGIRGTKDRRDIQADAVIPFGQLVNTQRYKGDERAIRQFKAKYPTFTLYAVGHSLGGAIIDLLLHKNLVDEAVSFNPAIEPHYLRYSTENHRIYNENDPLYAIMGRFSLNPDVRKGKDRKWWEVLLSKIKYTKNAIEIYSRLQAHKVENITQANA